MQWRRRKRGNRLSDEEQWREEDPEYARYLDSVKGNNGDEESTDEEQERPDMMP